MNRTIHTRRSAKEFLATNSFRFFLKFLLTVAGCTPLHWAVLRGNIEACNVLVHAGTKQELAVQDKTGCTPAKIASDKGYRHIALLLVRQFYCYYLQIFSHTFLP